jgi:hypothetical protein
MKYIMTMLVSVVNFIINSCSNFQWALQQIIETRNLYSYHLDTEWTIQGESHVGLKEYHCQSFVTEFCTFLVDMTQHLNGITLQL